MQKPIKVTRRAGKARQSAVYTIDGLNVLDMQRVVDMLRRDRSSYSLASEIDEQFRKVCPAYNS